MNKYTVRFWYHTDLRAEEVVRAHSYPAALVLGLEAIREADWAHDRGFRIEIIAGEVP